MLIVKLQIKKYFNFELTLNPCPYPNLNTDTVADNLVIAKYINKGFTPMNYYNVCTVFRRYSLCITLFLSISLAKEELFCGVVWRCTTKPFIYSPLLVLV